VNRGIAALSLALLASASPSEAQVRRVYSIDSLVGGNAVESGGAEPKLSPIEQWLEANLPKRCEGVQQVEFRRTTERTYTSKTSGATSTTAIEVVGVGEFSPQVTSLLADLAAQAHRTVSVQARVVEGTRPATGPLENPSVDWLSPDEADALVKSLAQDANHELVSAPRIIVPQGQGSWLSVGRDISYIKDWELVDGGDEMIAEPHVDVLFEGLRMDIAPVVHPDGKTLTLSMDVLIATLERPVRKVDVVLAGKTVQRDVPELQTVQWSSGMLELPEDVRRFRVRGLRRRDPASGVAHDLDLVVSVDVGPATDARGGKVMAVDADSEHAKTDAKRVIVDYSGRGADLRPGSRLQVLRNDAPVATLVVERVEGSLVVARVVEGDTPIVGDAVR
jgi:hypothetical protein